MKLTKEKVIDIYNYFKEKVSLEINNAHFEAAASYIEKAAAWAVLFNFKYYDIDLEREIKKISNTLNFNVSFEAIPNRLVFVCSQINDAGELVRQYARALAENSIPTRMIVIDRIPNHAKTLKEIRGFNNIDLVMIPSNLGYIETALIIASQIADFKPSKILQHFIPDEVKALLAVSLFPNIPKFNINYTDHTFWLGASILDYNIEFRKAGGVLSKEKRCIRDDQLYILPFYPILESRKEFEGFPFKREGKVVLFSGSVPYKVFGDSDRYFKTLDRILQENDNSVAMISIKTRAIKKKVRGLTCRKKIYLVPWRRDFLEVVKNADILYNTYPMTGGLTSQTAAALKKPILSFTREKWFLADCDAFFNIEDKINGIEFTDIEKMCDYAKRLCSDEELRREEGNRVSSLLITREEFAKGVHDILTGGINRKLCIQGRLEIDYKGIESFFLDYENESKQYLDFLFRKEGISVYYKFPQYCLGFIPVSIRHTFNYFKKRLVLLLQKICQRKKN